MHGGISLLQVQGSACHNPAEEMLTALQCAQPPGPASLTQHGTLSLLSATGRVALSICK